MRTAIKSLSSTAFDVEALHSAREREIVSSINRVRRKARAEASNNLARWDPKPLSVIAFGTKFSIGLDTTLRFLADQVCAAMLNTTRRHYDVEVTRGIDDFQLTCIRRRQPVISKRSGAPVGFDFDNVFHAILLASGNKLNNSVDNMIRLVKQEAIERMPRPNGPFRVDVGGSPAVARLALKRLKQAQSNGWTVELSDSYDADQTFRFVPPTKKIAPSLQRCQGR